MSIFTLNDKSKLVEESKALLGRSGAIFHPDIHFVTKKSFNELNPVSYTHLTLPTTD